MALTYEQFKAAATPAHITLLSAIALEQPIRTSNMTDADAMKAVMTDLLTNRLVKVAREIWEWQGDILLRGYDAVLEPITVTYMSQLMIDAIADTP